MTLTEDAIQNFMADHDLESSIISYSESRPDLLQTGQAVTLLSSERRRLTRRQNRYQLYDIYGVCTVDGVALPEFQAALEKGVDLDAVEHWSYDVPNLDVIIKLVQAVNQQGFKVYGARHEQLATWDVTDEEHLKRALRKQRTVDYDQLIRIEPGEADNPTAETVMVDLGNHPVMTRYEPSEVRRMIYEEDFYDVRDANGHTVLTAIPLASLGAILLCLLLSMRPETIARLLLWPRLSAEAVETAALIYHEDYCSAEREVTTVSDLHLMAHLPVIKDDAHVTTYFQFHHEVNNEAYGPISNAILNEDLLTTLNRTYHSQYDDVAQADRQLTDWLVRTAFRADMFIERIERRKIGTFNIHKICVDDAGNLGEFEGKDRWYGEDYPHSTVFNVIERNLEELERYDLTFEALVTYVLSKPGVALPKPETLMTLPA